MAWMAMAHFTPPLSSQDAEMLGLVRVDKARRTICSCGEKVCPRRALHARDFVTLLTHWVRAKYQIGAPTSQLARANFHLGARQLIGWRARSDKLARQVTSWRAPSPVLARQVTSWRVPSPVLALQFNWLGFIGNCVAGFCVVLVVALVSLCALFNACSM